MGEVEAGSHRVMSEEFEEQELEKRPKMGYGVETMPQIVVFSVLLCFHPSHQKGALK